MVPSIKITVIAWGAVMAMCSFSFVLKDKTHVAPIHHSKAAKGFAVVELFTSEGCSSCPPADELIAKVQRENNDQPIYILAYHVDYWNRLGWKDQFSSAAYSQRQNRYASWLSASVYTPQAVVNGTREFVGSDEGTLRDAIDKGLQKATSAELTLTTVKPEPGVVNIHYHTTAVPAHTALLIALVQRNAVSKVLSGENNGRTLSHVQIVRSLKNINLNGKNEGSATIANTSGLNKQGLEIIAFLQNTDTGAIIAATKASLLNETSMAKAGMPGTK
ncbi:DUF1223 domain-containing protein [Mucilaginibacter polytrichastri]|uniref:DUF1223 domain-containing protein n=1 Tax=Mucilaginibacter polytrichastri TaxID=1302689 RepID=A0A1Q6A247_9SPHI|nr:DUF1223 domain-containing protein [Mucilaginibacter polytrichastri]OKS88083.1 hypothetical protein RG47T_3547 [Mucilaginibacter polytrichastri]SFT09902.1 hypothetical protein SAMN04487890_110158 [Mucilaginibacter polytrichastri]